MVKRAPPRGDLDMALGLRSARTNDGRFGRETPLVQASRRGNVEVVDLLIKSGASPRTLRNAYALCAAEFYGSREIADRLVTAGARPAVWCGKARAHLP